MKNNALLQILLEDAFCHVKKIIIRMALGKKNIQNPPTDIPLPSRREKSPLSYFLKFKPLDMINLHDAFNTTKN